MINQQRHQGVVDTFVKKMFLGNLKPGVKLSTEYQLSEEMGVGRTSLWIALKHLESMNVLEIRQGDGTYVKDYVKNAGMDFLRTLFQQESECEEVFLDEYLIDDLWEFWILLFPGMLELATKKYSNRDIKAHMSISAQEETL
jgi:DNA-binding FadR family transcriptional regulator